MRQYESEKRECYHIINIDNVSYHYDMGFCLQNISINIVKDATIAFVGANGAGKTTLFNLIFGILKPTNGSIYINHGLENQDIKNYVRYLPQFNTLFNKLTVEENLHTVCHFLKIKKEIINEITEKILTDINFIPLRNNLFETLSEGQKRILNYFATLIRTPKILLLDEPYSSLDIRHQELVNNSIFELKKKGCTVLISSHILDPLEEICDEYYFLDNGRIIDSHNSNILKTNNLHNLLKEKFLKPDL